jgi:uncharacterized protein
LTSHSAYPTYLTMRKNASSVVTTHPLGSRVAMALFVIAVVGTACLKPVPVEPQVRSSVASDGAVSCVGQGPLPPQTQAQNVLGAPLVACPSRHRTGFYRQGYCNTGSNDRGVHVVCASVTEQFLAYSRAQGNDLITPRGEFPGLQPGDGWCLCAERWREANEAGVAPGVYLEATDARALDFINMRALVTHATPLPSAEVH